MYLSITDFGYKRLNVAVYSCEFLEMLRHPEVFVVRKLFRIRKSPI
jgi:hypothetical protein